MLKHLKGGRFLMPIPWSLAACFIAGLILIALIGKLLLIPHRFFWRLILNGIAGAFLLAGINFLSSFTNISIPVNPFSALTAGFLGIPGVLLLVILKFLL